MRLRLVVLGLALCVSIPAGAQTIQDPVSKKPVDLWARPGEPGTWIDWENSCDVTDPLLGTWEKQLRSIAALVSACPVFRNIRGYYPALAGCVERPGGGIGQYGGTVHFLIWPPVTVERAPTGEPRVRKEWKGNHPSGISLMFRVNAYGDLAFSWHHWEDKEGRFYELPETSREIGGFPVIGGFLFVSLPGKPPLFTPITQERAQRWMIDNMKRQADADAAMLASAHRQYQEFVSPAGQTRRAKKIEEAAASQRKPENQELERRHAIAIDQRREQDLKAAATPKPDSPAARTTERLTQLESRLAAMSPEQRRLPAWYKTHAEGVRRLDYGDIVEAGSPGARPLVVTNPDFYDKALPKTAMQLVSIPSAGYVESEFRKGGTSPTVQVPMAVLEQMDWRAVAAMLK